MAKTNLEASADLLRLAHVGPGYMALRKPSQFVAVYKLSGGPNPWVEDSETLLNKVRAFENALMQLQPGEEVQLMVRRIPYDPSLKIQEYKEKIDEDAPEMFRTQYPELLAAWLEDKTKYYALCTYEAYALYTIRQENVAALDTVVKGIAKKKGASTTSGVKLDEVLRRARGWASFLMQFGCEAVPASEEEIVRLVFEEFSLEPFAGDAKRILKSSATAVGVNGFPTIREKLAANPIIFSADHFRIGSTYAKNIYLMEFPDFREGELFFTQLYEQREKFKITLFAKGLDQETAKKTLSRQLRGDLATSENGFIPNFESQASLKERAAVLDTVAKKETALIRFSCYITIYGKNTNELTSNEENFRTRFAGVHRFGGFFEQKELFQSTLPMATDVSGHEYIVTTSSLMNCWPFFTDSMANKNGVPFGITKSIQLGCADPWSREQENWNAVVFGLAGSGKSFSINQLAVRYMPFNPYVMVVDKSKSYEFLCKSVGGAYLNISLQGDVTINPFDCQLEDLKESKGEVPSEKVAEVLGFLNVLLAEEGEKGLKNLDNSILEEAIKETYLNCYQDKKGSKIPVLSDLRKTLQEMAKDKERSNEWQDTCRKYYETLGPYTDKGTFANLTDRPTKGISEDNQFIVFDTSSLPENSNLLSLAVYITSQYCLEKARLNKKIGRKTLLLLDEAWYLAKFPAGVNFLLTLAKRSRHLGLATFCATQQVQDFLSNPDVRPILDNSAIKYFFKLGATEIKLAQDLFGLNQKEIAAFGLRQSKGNYSPAFVISSEKRGTIFITPDPASYWLSTTFPPEVLEREKYMKKYNPDNTLDGLWKGLFRLLADKQNGRTLEA